MASATLGREQESEESAKPGGNMVKRNTEEMLMVLDTKAVFADRTSVYVSMPNRDPRFWLLSSHPSYHY